MKRKTKPFNFGHNLEIGYDLKGVAGVQIVWRKCHTIKQLRYLVMRALLKKTVSYRYDLHGSNWSIVLY